MTLTKSLLIMTLAGGTLWAQTPATNSAQAPANAKPKTAAQTAAKPTAVNPATVKPGAAKPVATATKPVAATTSAAKPAVNAAASKAPAVKTADAKKVEVKSAEVKKAEVKKPEVKKAEVKPAIAKAPAAAQKPAVPAVKPVIAAKKPAVAEKKVTPFTAKKAESDLKVVHPASAKEAQTATRVGSAATMPGKRDPFVSPIVRATSGGPGAGCETGKRCLMVDQINLMGIVKSQNGFIAVVENAAKRSYFLRENDPIFNGSVAKITGDTVVFREQTTDKLGKQGVREVVKKVNAPVV